MTCRDREAYWVGEPFLRDATTWVDDALAAHSIRRTGPLDAHKVRFWAAVYRVPTTHGTRWFKACAPALGHEPAVTQAMADVAPQLVLRPLAIDAEQAWMLSPDGGPTLRDTATHPVEGLTQAVQVLATMQRELSAHKDVLLTAGLPVLHASDAPSFFAAEVERLTALPEGHVAHLTAAAAAQLRRAWNHATLDIQLLEASRIPPSLQHNDLHDGNIFTAGRTGHTSVFDLGDAVWSHPFAALHVPLTAAATQADASRIRDAYLQHWEDCGSPAQLRREAQAALRLGKLHRYRAWSVLLCDADHAALAHQHSYVPHLPSYLHEVTTP